MYKIVGADKKEYGPVSIEQVRNWIKQGRSNAQTLISFEGGPWKPLATFPEFSSDLQPPPVAGLSSRYAAPARKNSAAVCGLVFSILGLLCCPLGASIIGIVCGAIGYSQIKDSPERYATGKNVALAAIIIGALGVLLNIGLYSSGAWDAIIRNWTKP